MVAFVRVAFTNLTTRSGIFACAPSLRSLRNVFIPGVIFKEALQAWALAARASCRRTVWSTSCWRHIPGLCERTAVPLLAELSAPFMPSTVVDDHFNPSSLKSFSRRSTNNFAPLFHFLLVGSSNSGSAFTSLGWCRHIRQGTLGNVFARFFLFLIASSSSSSSSSTFACLGCWRRHLRAQNSLHHVYMHCVPSLKGLDRER
mmetsp:Transcript_25382/g.50955  ORF Transcript_25382/g.50955 Transcript_25382/m.50955 type:complete len:202 (-) Transcript_25382:61-666(-)